MKLLRNRSNRLLVLAVLSAVAFCLHASGILPMDFVNPMSSAGCAGTPTHIAIPADIGELPPVDRMILEKHKRSGVKRITVERGDVIELAYKTSDDNTEKLEQVTFLGLDPGTRTLGLLTEFGERLAIESSAITRITLVMENRPLRAILLPTLAAVVGVGSGAIIGAAAGNAAAGTAFGTGCAAAPAVAIAIPVGLAPSIDRKRRVGDKKWRIVMPPSEPVPAERLEPPPDTIPAPAVETQADAGAESDSSRDAG